jgi:hypothetical protein
MDMPEGRLGEVWLAIKQLTTRDGMTPEKISPNIIGLLGVSTQQEAYDLIRQVLDRLPEGKTTEAIRYALGGEGYSSQASQRQAMLARKYGVTTRTVWAWALKGARFVASQLLSQTTQLGSEPKTLDVSTVSEVLLLMREQVALLREIRDLLRK